MLERVRTAKGEDFRQSDGERIPFDCPSLNAELLAPCEFAALCSVCFPLPASCVCSAQHSSLAVGGLSRADPEDVHAIGACPDETGLQYEGRDAAPQAREEE